VNEPDKILCADGHLLDAKIFRANNEAKGTVIIASALGVHHRYYHRFAEFVSRNAHHAICFNYRGTGSSNNHNGNNAQPGLIEWGTKDLEAAIQLALSYKKPIYLVGHSIGGQLFPMAASAHDIQKAFVVAASAPYWKRWKFPINLGLLFFSAIFLPIAARLGKKFPNRIFGLGNLPTDSSLMREWARWMLSPEYFLDEKFNPEAKARFKRFDNPVMALGFTDDKMAPEENVRALMAFYAGENKLTRIIDSGTELEEAIGHNGFFKAKFSKTLWPKALDFFER